MSRECAHGRARSLRVKGNSVTFEDAATVARRVLGGLNPLECLSSPALSPTPIILTLATHGDLVQQCFYVVTTADTSITFAEAIFQGS